MISKQRFVKVWNKFCKFYLKYGCKGMDELWGGYFREESDIVFHLARICTEEFGIGYVHLNSPVHNLYFSNFPKKKKQHIDIDITRPDLFSKPNVTHGIFVEVKWIYKDFLKQPFGRGRLNQIVESIEKDLQKLADNLKNGKCKHAFMCIVDDEGKASQVSIWKRKYPSVNILLCSCNKRSDKNGESENHWMSAC